MCERRTKPALALRGIALTDSSGQERVLPPVEVPPGAITVVAPSDAPPSGTWACWVTAGALATEGLAAEFVRVAAGARPARKGTVEVATADGRPCPADRTAFVPSSYALLPQYTIRQNILYWLPGDAPGADDVTRQQDLDELARALRLTAVLDRYPDRISSRSRLDVAVARAMMARPPAVVVAHPQTDVAVDELCQLLGLAMEAVENSHPGVLVVTAETPKFPQDRP